MTIRIPECNEYNECPKCRATIVEFGETTYHSAYVDDQPCGDLVITTDLTGLGDHLCKRCSRCGFGWVEKVSIEGSIYQTSEEPEEYEPCGCDYHGDHLGCDENCRGRGCTG